MFYFLYQALNDIRNLSDHWSLFYFNLLLYSLTINFLKSNFQFFGCFLNKQLPMNLVQNMLNYAHLILHAQMGVSMVCNGHLIINVLFSFHGVEIKNN